MSKRIHKRSPCNIPVHIYSYGSNEGRIDATILNISAGGCKILLKTLLKQVDVGDKIKILLQTDDKILNDKVIISKVVLVESNGHFLRLVFNGISLNTKKYLETLVNDNINKIKTGNKDSK